jgi:hypothetical protein
MLPEKIAYITIVISLIGSFFFIRSIIKGIARPNLVTWFFWALAPLVTTFLQVKAGAGLSALPVFLGGFFPLIIFFVALFKRNNYWKITIFDIFCGIFSLIALVLWILTHKADISIVFALISDFLAAIPTIKKSWTNPETESSFGYSPGIINNIIGLLIIKNWTFSIYSFAVYMITLNTSLIILIKRKSIRKIFS